MTKKTLFFLCVFLLFGACQSDETAPNANTGYIIEDGQIILDSAPITLNGVNALHSFGLEELSLMQSWKVKIVREFMGNLREQPIDGGAIQGTDGTWLHPLEQIVLRNRAAGIVTILCPFGWVNENGEQLLFTGLNPADQDFYPIYETKMANIARHFAGQDDVWLEVWNEPYHWNNENGYSHNLWLNDMTAMVENLRSVSGFDNIIVVPGNEQGQSEDALLAEGATLMSRYDNIIFDLHAYEKWLNDQTTSDIAQRFAALQSREFPFLMGEIGVRNVGELMDPSSFLEVANTNQVSTMAWLWKRDAQDQSALLNEDDQPNDLNNNTWGSTYRDFLNNE